MGHIVLKVGDNVKIISEEDFPSENREKDLHKLLKNYPKIIESLLSDEQEIRLLGSEIRLPSGGRLDLLFVTSKGNLILVELKRERSHREAIAQLFDYASDIQSMSFAELMNRIGKNIKTPIELCEELFEDISEEAKEEFERMIRTTMTEPKSLKLVLVSYSFGEDTIRVVSWLRKASFDINLIEFDYFRDGNLEMFVPRLLFSDDAEMSKTTTKTSEAGIIYETFFSDVLSIFKEIKPGVTERRARAKSRLKIPLGHTETYLEWKILGKPYDKRVRVSLMIKQTAPNAKKLYTVLAERKEQIIQSLREKISEEVYWEEDANKKALPIIYVEKPAGSLYNLPNNEDIKQWAVNTMITFYEVLKPIIDEIFQKMK